MKTVATLNGTQVEAITVENDAYQLTTNQRLVTNPAYVGGVFLDGWFYPPQIFASWQPVEGVWEPPVPYPTDGQDYDWNEDDQTWVARLTP